MVSDAAGDEQPFRLDGFEEGQRDSRLDGELGEGEGLLTGVR